MVECQALHLCACMHLIIVLLQQIIKFRRVTTLLNYTTVIPQTSYIVVSYDVVPVQLTQVRVTLRVRYSIVARCSDNHNYMCHICAKEFLNSSFN